MDTESAMRRRNNSQSSENPKGKKRKLRREPVEKLARVPREEARQEPKTQETLYFQSECTKESCNQDQGCKKHNETHNTCICTNTGIISSKDYPCSLSEDGGTMRKWLLPPRRAEVEDLYFESECTSESCGSEQGCMQFNETHKTCICTSTGIISLKHQPCPRNPVPGSTGGKPLFGVLPPPPSNRQSLKPANSSSSPFSVPTQQTSANQSHIKIDFKTGLETNFRTDIKTAQATTVNNPHILGASVESSAGLLLIALVGCVALFIIVVPAIVWYMRRRICTVNGKTKPRVRPGEPLLAERYITNPQYGVYGSNPAPTPTDDTNEPQVPLLDRHALTFLEEVGEGCFGKVHKGLLRASSGEQVVAIKVLKESASRSAEEDFVREVSIMSAFRHENILALVGVVYREDINASPWMVFEYMEWGDLAGVLRGSRGGGRPGPNLDEPALLQVALQVARGMQYLASRRFVHRDLAARNCLVGSNLAVKIADFGMSRDVYTCDYYKMGGERPMPVRWMSPESIVYARFTHESDVWSYGVVLWEIYSRGKQPFYGHNNDGATRLILQGIVLVPPEECPRFACELMRACWQTDPRDRINFNEICRKLEVAAGSPTQMAQSLPRPPVSPTPQDSAGYLIPARQPPVDYLTLSLPEPEGESSSESSEDEEEYT